MSTGQSPPLAVVPLKALQRAKGRLAGHLDRSQRRALTEWMVARVVAACRAASSLRGVLVVAGDEPAAALARRFTSDVVVEPAPGLAAAMAAADRAAAGSAASLVVAADLPFVSPADLNAVCRVGAEGPCVVVVPTHDGGTAALLRRPAAVVATRYGPGSAAAHLRAAREAGIAAARVDLPALAIDVDTADDLREAGSRDADFARLVAGLSVC